MVGRRSLAALVSAVAMLTVAAALARPMGAFAQTGGAEEAADLQRRELRIISQLDRIDRRLAELGGRERQMAEALEKLGRKEAAATHQTVVMARRVVAARRNLSTRLKVLYVNGYTEQARAMTTAPELASAVLAWQSLARLVRFDLALIKDYNGRRQLLAEAEKELKAKKKELEAFRAKLSRSRRELDDQRRRRAQMLVELEKQRQVYRATVSELDRTARRLTARAAAGEESRPPAKTDLSRAKGSLPWPVEGRLTTIPGSERNGVLIRAEEGLPVQAVGPGRVAFAGWVKGFGSVVIVDHGLRYYTLSGHLEELQVKEGETVGQGSIIGLVGRAGLARAGVYFEIRHRDKPLDPRLWLTKNKG